MSSKSDVDNYSFVVDGGCVLTNLLVEIVDWELSSIYINVISDGKAQQNVSQIPTFTMRAIQENITYRNYSI